jgi:hypothetical protein
MENAPDQGVGWRKRLAEWLIVNLGIIVIDPTNKPIDIVPEDSASMTRRNQMKLQGNWKDYQAECRLMRCVDLRLVDIADFLIVNIDLNIHACGTYEELFLANRSKKPIIVRYVQGKQAMSDWMAGTLPHEMIFSTWYEIETYLEHISFGDKIETLKRWLFFDRNKL